MTDSYKGIPASTDHSVSSKRRRYRGQIILTLLFLVSSINLLAQQDDNIFYIHGGISLSAVQGGAGRGFSKINVLGGVGLLMPIEDVWKFGLEANVVQKGERVFGIANFQLEEYIANLVYAQAVGYLSYDFSDRISAFLGPGIGVLIHQDERNRFSAPGTVETEFRTIEVSAVGGVRFHLTDLIGLVVRFDQSVLPVKKGTEGVNLSQITGARQYNTVAAFCVEFKF